MNKHAGLIILVGALVFSTPPSQAASVKQLIYAIENLDRANARLELDTHLAIPRRHENHERSFEPIMVATNASGVATWGLLLKENFRDPVRSPATAGTIVGLAAVTAYFAAVGGNRAGLWEYEDPDGSSGGALLLGAAAMNAWGTLGVCAYMTEGRNSMIAAVGMIVGTAYLSFEGLKRSSTAIRSSGEKTAGLNSDDFLSGESIAVNLKTERAIHLLRKERDPLAVAIIKERVANLVQTKSDADLFLEIADLEDDKGERLVAEDLALSASALSKTSVDRFAVLEKHLPEKVTLAERADSSLKLLQARISYLEEYLKEEPSEKLSKAVQSAKQGERAARMFLGLI